MQKKSTPKQIKDNFFICFSLTGTAFALVQAFRRFLLIVSRKTFNTMASNYTNYETEITYKDFFALAVVQSVDKYLTHVIHVEKTAENAEIVNFLVQAVTRIAEKHNIKIC